MKKILVLIAAAISLSACGSDDVDPAVDGSPRWTTITDPETGKTYRCYSYYIDGGYDGGPALFCDEV